MTRLPGPAGGKQLLFWDGPAGQLQPVLDALGVVPRGLHGQPRDHVRRDVPRQDREELARALEGGTVLKRYRGLASCRICGELLGSQDLIGHGFVWPQRASHYVLVHDVWTPECAEMLSAIRRSKADA